jgi:hypothetical protein
MADTRWNSRKIAGPLPARLKRGQDGLDNQTGLRRWRRRGRSHRRRAAAEAHRSGDLAGAPMFCEMALVSPEKPALRSPAGKRLVTQPV